MGRVQAAGRFYSLRAALVMSITLLGVSQRCCRCMESIHSRKLLQFDLSKEIYDGDAASLASSINGLEDAVKRRGDSRKSQNSEEEDYGSHGDEEEDYGSHEHEEEDHGSHGDEEEDYGSHGDEEDDYGSHEHEEGEDDGSDGEEIEDYGSYLDKDEDVYGSWDDEGSYGSDEDEADRNWNGQAHSRSFSDGEEDYYYEYGEAEYEEFDDGDCSIDLEALIGMDDEIVFPAAYLEDGAIDIQALRDDLEMRISCWEGYVWAIDFSEAGERARGPLPKSWSRLTELRTLILTNNFFTGRLPSQYSTLTNLEELVISSQQFLTGVLPAEYSTLKSLNFMNFEHGSLQSTLPAEYSELHNLESLWLSGNAISGTLPPEYSSMNLVAIWLEECLLSGPLPSEYSAISSLLAIELADNRLSSTLPPQYSVLELQELALDRNRIRGSLPVQYSTITSLTRLSLSSSFLSGTLPPQYSLLSLLNTMEMTNCKLDGSLPAQFSNMIGISVVDLSGNQLTGSLPPEYSTWKFMSYTSFSFNDITGTLPPEWSAMSTVQQLELEGNRLEGHIPLVWGEGMRFMIDLFIEPEIRGPECQEDKIALESLDPCPFPLYVFDEELDEDDMEGLLVVTAWNITVFSEIGSKAFHGNNPGFANRKLQQIRDLSGTGEEIVNLYLDDLADFCNVERNEVELVNAVESGEPLNEGGTLLITASLTLPSSEGARAASITSSLVRSGREIFSAVEDAGFFVEFTVAERRAEYEKSRDPGQDDNVNGDGTEQAKNDSSTTSDTSLGAESNRIFLIVSIAIGSLACVAGVSAAFFWLVIKPRIKAKSMKYKSNMAFSSDHQLLGSFVNTPNWVQKKRTGGHDVSYVKIGSPHDSNIQVSKCLSQMVVMSTRHALHISKSQKLTCEPGAEFRTGSLLACILAMYWQWARHILLIVVTQTSFRMSSTDSGSSSHAFHMSLEIRRRKKLHPLPGTPEEAPQQAQLVSEYASTDLQVDFNKEIKGKLTHVLGEGGFGVVYKAQWRGLDVAVKMFSSSTSTEKQYQIQSFKAELKTMAKLTKGCDQIVRMHGACLQPPNTCIIYEYVPGGSLHDMIYKSTKPLELLQLLNIWKDIAKGLAFMHPGIVHRDLKPQNIMLDASGNAKICDLGLSRGKDPLQSYLVTTAGGTPAYMAPEVFTSSKIHDKADMYAMGIIMNECLCRSAPFACYDMPFQIIYAVSIKKERPSLPQGCPEPLVRLITKCWDDDVNRRPSALELIRLLDFLIDGEQSK